jgi:hypothetical protein
LVFTGGISNDLDLDGRRCQVLYFLLETVINVGIAGGTTTHDDGLEESLSDIDITGLDGRVAEFVHALDIFSNIHRLEESFRASDHLVAKGDNGSIWQVIGLFLFTAFRESLQFSLIIKSYIS